MYIELFLINERKLSRKTFLKSLSMCPLIYMNEFRLTYLCLKTKFNKKNVSRYWIFKFRFAMFLQLKKHHSLKSGVLDFENVHLDGPRAYPDQTPSCPKSEPDFKSRQTPEIWPNVSTCICQINKRRGLMKVKNKTSMLHTFFLFLQNMHILQNKKKNEKI